MSGPPVDLSLVRGGKEKEALEASRCDYCGELAHDAQFDCPRVEAVVYHMEHGVVIAVEARLRDDYDYEEPDDAA